MIGKQLKRLVNRKIGREIIRKADRYKQKKSERD